MIEIINKPWAWYVAGPLIGLTVPLLLIVGNKSFGISSSLRHVCAACFPANISFFKYDWKKELWNLIFVAGIFIGAVFAFIFTSTETSEINAALQHELISYGIVDLTGFLPKEIVNWSSLWTLKGFLMIVVGGFMIGFGTRYAGGCTSGHSIMGLSAFQLPSLIATVCFMLGGFVMANLILPFILRL